MTGDPGRRGHRERQRRGRMRDIYPLRTFAPIVCRFVPAFHLSKRQLVLERREDLPLQLPIIMTIRHFDFSVFLVFNPGDLYYLGYKKIIIITATVFMVLSL